MRYAVKVGLKEHAPSLLSRFHIFMNDEWRTRSRGISTYKQTVIEAQRLTQATLQDKVRFMNVKMMKLEYSHLGIPIFVSSST
jgi:hypothetical protein